MKTTGETRVSFTFFPSDVKAMRKVHLALLDEGIELSRAHALRLVLFAASEADLLAQTIARLKAENEGAADPGPVEERFTAVLPNEELKKINRVVADLARQDIDAERTTIVRAAIHASDDVKALLRALPKLGKAFPDKRSLRGKKK